MHTEIGIIVTARNEQARLPATLAALRAAFPGAPVVVADDASADATPAVACVAGAEVVSTACRLGKGGAATLGARHLLDRCTPRLVVLCDADLGDSAAALPALTAALEHDAPALVVAAFARRAGGGLGLVVATARRAVERATGLRPRAPLSGQRALRAADLPGLLPFAASYGMEVGMTIDAHRAGLPLIEVELPLEHRSTGRTPAAFLHRGRQLLDVVRAAAARRAPAAGRARRLAS